MTAVDIDKLLTTADSFINTMHVVRDAIHLAPTKAHVATCIDYVDLQEMRRQFVEELVDTVVPFVYSLDKQQQLIEHFSRSRTEAAAWSRIARLARQKFRSTDLRGQFSELILCNVLQHHFRAAPLLRKMPLTTNPNLERNGADAIHIARNGASYDLFFGEAKTYDRKAGALQDALTDAIHDAVTKHAPHHANELELYAYEDFVPPQLEAVARDYLEGRAKDIQLNLVCIATYGNYSPVVGATRTELLQSTIASLKTACAAAAIANKIRTIPAELLPRMHYVIFPVRELTTLIEAFKSELGA